MYIVPCTTRKTYDEKHAYSVRLKRDGAIRRYCDRVGSSQASKIVIIDTWNESSRQNHGVLTGITCRVIMDVMKA